MKRTLILVEDLPVPFDRRVWSEAKTLRDDGWDVTIVCPRGDGARRWHERLDGIEVFRYPLPTTAAGLLNHILEYLVAIPATLALSILALRRGRFDVVHACNPPDFLFPIGWFFKRLGSSFIFDQHDLAPEVFIAQGGRKDGVIHRLLIWCERKTYQAADIVIATNETYRRFAIERGGVSADRVFVVRSSPDPGRIYPVSPDSDLKDGRRYLVAYLGTMGPQDGVDLFVEAAVELEKLLPNQIKFIAMGGGGQLAELRQRATETTLNGRLSFPGRVSDEFVRKVLSTADVAISPDPANDFNEHCTMNKTLEYMAVGVPIVAFDLNETRVSAGNAAVYAKPNDPLDLARETAELLRSPERGAEMSRAGRKRINGKLAWNESAKHLIAAYCAAIQKPTSR